MQNEKILTIIATSDPDSLLEVALCATVTEKPALELRRLSWGEGVGWYRQHTLRLDAGEAEELLQVLRESRHAWSQRPARPRGKVIPFPANTRLHEHATQKTA